MIVSSSLYSALANAQNLHSLMDPWRCSSEILVLCSHHHNFRDEINEHFTHPHHHHYPFHIGPHFLSLLTFPCGSFGLLLKCLNWLFTFHGLLTVPHILWMCRPPRSNYSHHCVKHESGITPWCSPNGKVYILQVFGNFIKSISISSG